MSALVEGEVSVLHCGCFNGVFDSDSVGVLGCECRPEQSFSTGNRTPTVWFVVGILLSELSRLRCLSVTCLFNLFIINLQEGAGAHYEFRSAGCGFSFQGLHCFCRGREGL